MKSLAPFSNIVSLFESRYPRDDAEIFIETENNQYFNYGVLKAESCRIANMIEALDIKPGDRIAVQTAKSAQTIFLYIACLRAGCVYLPLNTGYTESELGYFIDNAEPSLVVCDPGKQDIFKSLCKKSACHVLTLNGEGLGTLTEQSRPYPVSHTIVDRDPDDTAVILYTSGTTGQPKGAMISHNNLAANGLALHQAWGWKKDDVLLHALPVFHIHGLFVACHCVLLSGSKMLFISRFSTDAVIRLLPEATVMMGVPTFYTRLLADRNFNAEVCRNMRLFTSGSAPLLEQTFDEFYKRTGHTLLERYGMTETGMNTSNPLEGKRIASTVGPALPGVELRIVDDDNRPVGENKVGNLQVRGENVFSGYWRMPEKTSEEFTDDGYFKTGDLAKMDNNGYVSIVGRSKDMIITGGYNVYPKEIEKMIDDMDGVKESAVIGLPHPDFGEAVTAVVVPDDDTTGHIEMSIISSLRERMAGYKIPKQVVFLESLPRNTMGKVQKNVLREQYAELYQ